MEEKAIKALASYLALSNASEFIRSHGEEGFAFEDDGLDREYKRACKRIAEQLNSRADKFMQKYAETGIIIDACVND